MRLNSLKGSLFDTAPPDAGMLEVLVSMGFPPDLAAAGLSNVKNRSIDLAIGWYAVKNTRKFIMDFYTYFTSSPGLMNIVSIPLSKPSTLFNFFLCLPSILIFLQIDQQQRRVHRLYLRQRQLPLHSRLLPLSRTYWNIGFSYYFCLHVYMNEFYLLFFQCGLVNFQISLLIPECRRKETVRRITCIYFL